MSMEVMQPGNDYECYGCGDDFPYAEGYECFHCDYFACRACRKGKFGADRCHKYPGGHDWERCNASGHEDEP